MITTYFDKHCVLLSSSQGLTTGEACSALWFHIPRQQGTRRLLELGVSAFDSFSCYFWLATTGGARSRKVLELKRAFGWWSVPKADVRSTGELVSPDGQTFYSDIAEINAGTMDEFAKLIGRNSFGIDSTLFFLPTGRRIPSDGRFVDGLEKLLLLRIGSSELRASGETIGLVERFVKDVVSSNGVAAVVLRDSNMSTIVVTVGNRFAINGASQFVTGECDDSDWCTIASESEFLGLLDIGVSISAIS